MNKIGQYSIEMSRKNLGLCREALSRHFFKTGEPLRQVENSDMWVLSPEARPLLYDLVTGFSPLDKLKGGVDDAFQ